MVEGTALLEEPHDAIYFIFFIDKDFLKWQKEAWIWLEIIGLDTEGDEFCAVAISLTIF